MLRHPLEEIRAHTAESMSFVHNLSNKLADRAVRNSSCNISSTTRVRKGLTDIDMDYEGHRRAIAEGKHAHTCWRQACHARSNLLPYPW